MMYAIRAALAAVGLCVFAPAPANTAMPLTLDDAFDRVIATHPDLDAYRFAEAARLAEADQARQSPPRRVELDAENLLGSGAIAGVRSAELTLSLSSVIERGGKLAARSAVAELRIEGPELLREARRLDLLAEVARRFLDAAAAESLAALSREDLVQRERMAAAVADRHRAGIELASVPLAAEAARLRVAAELERQLRSAAHSRRRLAVLWGSSAENYSLATVDLGRLPELPDYRVLTGLLSQTPALLQFAHETRVREARLQLARSAAATDIDWQIGLRRYQQGSDWGLVGSVSIPLGNVRRSLPGVQIIEAELAQIAFEREGYQRALEATLAEAWGQLDLAIDRAERIENDLLPALMRAADAAERSYRAGASSHLEWAQLQSDIIQTRRERLDVSLAAHRALIELQRLTGQTLSVPASSDRGATP